VIDLQLHPERIPEKKPLANWSSLWVEPAAPIVTARAAGKQGTAGSKLFFSNCSRPAAADPGCFAPHGEASSGLSGHTFRWDKAQQVLA